MANNKVRVSRLRLEKRIKLFCAGKGIDPDDRPKFSSARAQSALEAFARLHGQGDEADLVADLLADLMHLCESRGIEFDELLDTARSNFDGERRV